LLTADLENAVKIATSNAKHSIFYVPIAGRNSGLSFFFDEQKEQIDSGSIVVVYSKSGESKIKGLKTYYDQVVLHNDGRNYFSGSIASYSLKNNLKYEYGFENGEVEWRGFEAPRETKTQLIQTNSTHQKSNDSEECEWWGHYTEWSDGSVTLEYVYLVCKSSSGCKTQVVNTSTGPLYFKVNCGGGGGYEEEESDPFGIDCASFIFVKTASNWQEAGIQNHRIKMVWMGGERHGYSISVTINSPIIIGLPIDRVSGIKYSEGQAAEVAAGAIQMATVLTSQGLKREPYQPSNAKIEETFRKYLNEILIPYAGTAGRTGSGSSAIYINKNPNYKIFGNGDCD